MWLQGFYDGEEQGVVNAARRDIGTPSWSSLETKTWVRPQVDPPPAGGAIEVRYHLDQVTVKGSRPGGLIPGC